MAAEIALDAIPKGRRSLKVLDPMSGSGTTLEYALRRGHDPIGFDCDPLAVLISRVRCAHVSANAIKRASDRVLERTRELMKTRRMNYPEHFDKETKRFVLFWFDERARRELSALARSISKERGGVRDALWCAFSRMIIVKSVGVSRAIDVAHSRPHRRYEVAPVRPLEMFPKCVTRVSRYTRENSTTGSRSVVALGDARRLPLGRNSVDIIVTSPPYLNAIDYLRGHRLSLVWMGWTLGSLRSIRENSIGSESGKRHQDDDSDLLTRAFGPRTIRFLGQRQRRILKTYAVDMKLAVTEMHRVLRKGGTATFVVADSYVCSAYVRNSDLVEELARKLGFEFVSRTRRAIKANRRYLPLPSRDDNSLGKRMRAEIILTYRKR